MPIPSAPIEKRMSPKPQTNSHRYLRRGLHPCRNTGTRGQLRSDKPESISPALEKVEKYRRRHTAPGHVPPNH